MPFVIILFLIILDISSIDLDKRILLPIGLFIAYILMTSFLSTALLTHGLLIACLLLFALPRDNGKDKRLND